MWQEDIYKLLRDTNTSDFVLKSIHGSKVFPVHRIILSARSNVFRSMFASATDTIGEAIVEDIDNDTLEELIHFLYTGSLSGSKCDIISLCYAANKYELPSLMNLVCLKLRSMKLDVTQIANLFIASEILSNEELFVIAKDRLTESLWEKGTSVEDLIKRTVQVPMVLGKIKASREDFAKEELNRKILKATVN